MDHIGESKPGHFYRERFDLAGPYRNNAVVNSGQRESPDPVKQAAHGQRFHLATACTIVLVVETAAWAV